MRIVFFGTSRFAAAILAHLVHHSHAEIAAVVTRPERPQGRSLRLLASPVQQQAVQLLPATPLFQPEKASTEEFAAILRGFVPDLFVVVAYGEIIKENLLRMPRYGCVNIHASLLPKYRGAAPMQRCLMAGEQETGITIIEMVRALDAGPMLESVSVKIGENTTFGELEQRMQTAACEALDKTLLAFEENRIVKVVQNEQEATYAAKLTPSEEKITWDMTAVAIHNRIRALSPTPGAWCVIRIGDQEKRLKIKRSIIRRDLAGSPGQILVLTKDSLIVACGEQALEIFEVQLEGKKSLAIADFLRGFSNSSFSF